MIEKFFLGTFSLALLSTTNAMAQNRSRTDSTTQTDSSRWLDQLEVTAIRASNRAPFAKAELTAKDLAKNNFGKDLPYLLNQTPSVVVNSDAGTGIGYTSFRIRGTDPSRTNVTINGIPYNDAESQGSYFVDIPDVASSAGSIQIQRGVGTSSNGAGAFGASVNINTNQINEKAYAQINNSYGSFNTWKNTVATGTGLINNHFYADVRLSNIQSDGYIQRAKSNLQSLAFSTGYTSEKTALRFNLITGKEKTYQAWNGVPEYMISYVRNYNELGVIDDTHTYKDQTDNYWQTHYQLFFNHKINDAFSFNVTSFLSRGKGYYEEYKSDQKYSKYGVAYPVSASNDTTYRTDLIRRRWLDNYFYGQTFVVQYKKRNTHIDVGGVWSQYNGKHYGEVIWAKNGGFDPYQKYYGDLPATKKDQNIYAKLLQTLPNHFNLYADVQYRHVSHNIQGYDDNINLFVKKNYQFFNPKIGLSYLYNGYNLFASYAIANREPNRNDLENEANKTVKSERLQDLELGLAKSGTNYHVGATFYYMHYKNQLVLTGQLNDVGAATNMNVPSSYRAGIELEGSVVFNKYINWNGNITLSRNKIKEFTSYISQYDDIDQDNYITQVEQVYRKTDISFSPNIVGAYSLNMLPLTNVELSFLGKYVGKQYMDNTQDNTRKLNDYYNQDVRLTWTLHNKFFKEWSIVGYMYNAFSKKYNTNGAAYPYWVQGNSQITNYNYYFPYALRHYTIGINIRL